MSKPFYKTAKWHHAKRKAVARAGYKCQHCGTDITKAFNVHHHKPLRARPDLALAPINHVALCPRCHGLIESGKARRIGCDVNGYPTGPDHPWYKVIEP